MKKTTADGNFPWSCVRKIKRLKKDGKTEEQEQKTGQPREDVGEHDRDWTRLFRMKKLEEMTSPSSSGWGRPGRMAHYMERNNMKNAAHRL